MLNYNKIFGIHIIIIQISQNNIFKMPIKIK